MATITVTTHIDEAFTGGTAQDEANDGAGLSLREAIALAGANDTIAFDAGVEPLLRLTLGEISVGVGLTIDGGGAITITGDAAGDDITLAGDITDVAASGAGLLDDNSRIFNAAADLTLDGLTLTGGRTVAAAESGGAVNGQQDITLLNSTVAGNSTAGADANGGAIFTFGNLAVTNSSISGNSTSGEDATGGAASIAGSVVVTNSAISGNSTSGDGADGGAFRTDSDITITNSTVSGNSTSGDGADGGALIARGVTAAITNSTVSGNSTAGANADGGGVFSRAALTVTDSIVLGNVALQADGDELFEDDFFSDGLVEFVGRNIVGADAAAFDTATGVAEGSTGTVQNAAAAAIFAATADNNGVAAGALADNGGDVLTIALRADAANPALDAATIGGTDARGAARGVDLNGVDNGGTSDLGAFELQSQVVFVPTFTSDAAFTAAENQTAAGTVAADDDKPGVTFSISGGADAALFTIDGASGELEFLAAPDFEAPGDAGADNVYDVEVTATDTDAQTSTQSLTVTVTNVNEAPVAAASAASGDEDTVISGALSATDVDDDTLTFSLVDGPSNGSVTINANGSFSYTPEDDFNGTDSFTFQASDGELTDTATATITVNPVDEPVDPPAPTGPTEGDDTLFGTDQNDTINALSGNDIVNGLAGDDLLLGAGGDDSLLGAAGDDRLRGNRGDDTVKGGGGNDNLKGNGGEDVIRGNGGDDDIRGGGGADNVKGGGGDDLIFGGGGADRLNGGGGADTIRGNGGDDTLKGNGGADVFQFRSNDRNDTILDFRQGQDKIQIQNGARSFDALRIEQDGADVLIGFGVAGQIRVVTDNVNAFDESDFIF